MQKAKEAEEANQTKSESTDKSTESSQDVATPKGRTQEASTPKQSSTVGVIQTPTSSSSRRKHQKGRSGSAREATLESFQKALNAAVAVGDKSSPKKEQNTTAGMRTPMSSTTTLPVGDSRRSFSEWEATTDSSVVWTPSQNLEQTFGYGDLNAASFTSVGESLPMSKLENLQQQNPNGDDAYMRVQFALQGEEWASHLHTPTESVSGHGAGSVDTTHNAMSYTPSLQHAALPTSRRGSSDDLADSMENIGIDTTGSYSLSQLSHSVDGTSWNVPSKGLDLAARRKRPRPAAIGTSGSYHHLGGPSSMSPTTRMPNFGTNHSMRHSKSAQCLNSRYAGVRKASAAPRSPFTFSTFADTGALNSAKAELSRRLRPSVSASTLAPSTPLTPEDLQGFLPTTPSDNVIYLSAQQPCDQFYSSTPQPMQVNIASPPSTPLAMGAVSPFAYQNVAPPISAPAHYTTFSDYTHCDGSLALNSWADAASKDTSFQHSIHVPQPISIPPITYEPVVDESSHTADSVSFSGSPPLDYSIEGTDMSSSGDVKSVTEFYIHEFPEQQGAHQFVTQPL